MRIKYTKQDIAELNQNPCVFNCTERLISYTYEFKIRALDLYAQGIKPKEIWRRSGFNTDKWRSNYFNETISDWKKINMIIPSNR